MQEAVNMMAMKMQEAVSMASIFGPFLAIIGVWMVFYHANMVKVFTSIKSNPGILYILGVINLLIGLSVLTRFNVWSWHLSLLLTIFGWVILIRGLLDLFLPQVMFKKVMSNKKTHAVKGIIIFIWGILLCWFGFWM